MAVTSSVELGIPSWRNYKYASQQNSALQRALTVPAEKLSSSSTHSKCVACNHSLLTLINYNFFVSRIAVQARLFERVLALTKHLLLQVRLVLH